jgi:undecaprenol kinase/diacylglycerol kinase (ATP)
MKSKRFSILKRIKSFGFAFNGLKILIQEEHNARVHVFAAIFVVLAGFYFQLSSLEWLAIIFTIGFVLTLEIINSAIENIADFVSLGKNDSIKKIKDLSAAGVLISALTALAIGFIIFIPKISTLF